MTAEFLYITLNPKAAEAAAEEAAKEAAKEAATTQLTFKNVSRLFKNFRIC